MAARSSAIDAAIGRPLRLPYHPLYRFYEGGSLTRTFRGLPDRPDDWWSEDWVGSCTVANNPGPDGASQGLSTVEVPGAGEVTLKELVETAPEAMVGAAFADRYGPITGVLVKLLSPAGQVPLHAHPSRAWAREHLGTPFGKTEAWILLDTPGDGPEPAYAGIGFKEGIPREWFADAVRRHDRAAVRETLHRTDIHPGEAYVAHAGVPYYLGPRDSFIEVQEPTDHIVIPETDGSDDEGATMGLGWDVALDMIDHSGCPRDEALGRARQVPTVVRESHGSREVRLFGSDVLKFFEVLGSKSWMSSRSRTAVSRSGSSQRATAASRASSAQSRFVAATRLPVPRACPIGSARADCRSKSSAARAPRWTDELPDSAAATASGRATGRPVADDRPAARHPGDRFANGTALLGARSPRTPPGWPGQSMDMEVSR